MKLANRLSSSNVLEGAMHVRCDLGVIFRLDIYPYKNITLEMYVYPVTEGRFKCRYI